MVWSIFRAIHKLWIGTKMKTLNSMKCKFEMSPDAYWESLFSTFNATQYSVHWAFPELVVRLLVNQTLQVSLNYLLSNMQTVCSFSKE